MYYEAGNKKGYSRLYISLSAGRVIRPLIVVENAKPLLTQEMVGKIAANELTWRDIVERGIIEMLDANEEENCLVAMSPEEATTKHTHLELYPGAMFGIAASIIPYPEHNQSPRNTYESAMAKQSLGFSTPTFPLSTFVRQHLLVNPQSPMVRTKSTELLNIDERPFGTNAVVAVLSFEGYNIEDAIIMNKSSIERGFARSFFYRLYEAESKQYLGGMRDTFEVPSAESNIRGYRGEKFYRLLEADGVVMHEATVTGGDAVIGRTSPPRFMEEYKEFEIKGPYRRDTSVAVRPTETGIVDSVFMTENARGREDVQGQGSRHEDARDRRQVRLPPRPEGSHRPRRATGGYALHRGRSRPRRHNQPARIPFKNDSGPVHRVHLWQGGVSQRLLCGRHRLRWGDT